MKKMKYRVCGQRTIEEPQGKSKCGDGYGLDRLREIAQAERAEQQCGGWISVKDRLPEALEVTIRHG